MPVSKSSLDVGAAERHVEVGVGVDPAGEDVLAAWRRWCVSKVPAGPDPGREDGGDLAVDDGDVGRVGVDRGDDGAALNEGAHGAGG